MYNEIKKEVLMEEQILTMSDSNNRLKECIKTYINRALSLWERDYKKEYPSLKDSFQDWSNWAGSSRVFLGGDKEGMDELSNEMDDLIAESKIMEDLEYLFKHENGFTRDSFEEVEKIKAGIKNEFLSDVFNLGDWADSEAEVQDLELFLCQAFFYKAINTFGPIYAEGKIFSEEIFSSKCSLLQRLMLSSSFKDFAKQTVNFYIREIEGKASSDEKKETFELAKISIEKEVIFLKGYQETIFNLMDPDDTKNKQDKLKDIEGVIDRSVLFKSKAGKNRSESVPIRRGTPPAPMNFVNNHIVKKKRDSYLPDFFYSSEGEPQQLKEIRRKGNRRGGDKPGEENPPFFIEVVNEDNKDGVKQAAEEINTNEARLTNNTNTLY